MKLTVGWWKARDGSKWHVDWVGEVVCSGHIEVGNAVRTWCVDGVYGNFSTNQFDLIEPWVDQKIRPWRPEEVPLGAWVRDKLYVEKAPNNKAIITAVAVEVFTASGAVYTYQYAFDNVEYSIDEGKIWHPCSVLEGVK